MVLHKERFDDKRLTGLIQERLDEIEQELMKIKQMNPDFDPVVYYPTPDEVLLEWEYREPFDAFPRVVTMAVQGIQFVTYPEGDVHRDEILVPPLTCEGLASVTEPWQLELLDKLMELDFPFYNNRVETLEAAALDIVIDHFFDRYSTEAEYEAALEEAIRHELERHRPQDEDEAAKLKQEMRKQAESLRLRLSDGSVIALFEGVTAHVELEEEDDDG
jgi:hypothetical protein